MADIIDRTNVTAEAEQQITDNPPRPKERVKTPKGKKGKLYSYAGCVLKIDLTTRTVEEYPFSDEYRRLYLGNKIMAARIFYDLLEKPFDAFDPQNVLIITAGPLNGTSAPSSSRFNVSGLSPLTGFYTSSNCGGDFGIKMKRAGYDAIILTGKSDEHVIVDIKPDFKVEFKNADKYWGMLTGQVQEALGGGKSGKLVIGPAGENLVRFSCLVSNERAAGRGGLGAVMGSKNVKGVVIDGIKTPLIELYDKDKFTDICAYWTKRLKKHPLTGVQLPKMGTAGILSALNTKKMLATKNFGRGQFEEFDKISGECLAEKYLVRNKGCTSCPIQCTRVVSVDGKNVKGPEVEIMGLMGANVLNNDLGKIIDWNYEMDELGMDTISCSGTIACAMELHEKGLWQTDLEFGNKDNVSQILHDIAFAATEEGKDLGQGSKRLAKKYGGEQYSISAKGMELAAYEPRGAVGQGLGYAVANRGGCHLNAGYMVIMEGLGLAIDQYTYKGKAAFTVTFQNLMEAISAGGNCLFTSYAFFPSFLITKPNCLMTRIVNKVAPYIGGVLAAVLRVPEVLAIELKPLFPHPLAIQYATGIKMSFGKTLRYGERGYNLERLIDQKLGVSAKHDVLPKRLTEDNQVSGDNRTKVPLDIMRKRYYKVRGWDENGLPTKKLLKRLKIDLKEEDK